MNIYHSPIPMYLMSCYAYEILSSSFLTDSQFDGLSHHIHEHWDEINHSHKKFIDRENCHSTSALTVEYYELPIIILTGTHDILGTDFKSSPIYEKIMTQLELRSVL